MAENGTSRRQKLLVMRHAQRYDDAHREWVQEPDVRTWDPPLSAEGVQQARTAGAKMRLDGVRISRIFVSPFLRCVQTAAGFIHGMFPDGSDISTLKVSIEYGLSELMNGKAIWYPPADPRNIAIWNLSLVELVREFPSGVVDVSLQPVFAKIPDWEETREDGRSRYLTTFYKLADKFPHENILCISHGESVKVAFTDLKPEVSVNYVHYCGYTEAEREVHTETSESPVSTGSWTMLTQLGPTSGLAFQDRSANSHVRKHIEKKNQHTDVLSQNGVQTQVETVA